MKRKMTQTVINIVAEESSDGEEDIDEDQLSEDEQHMEVDDEEIDVSVIDNGSDPESVVDLAASATDSDSDDDDGVDDVKDDSGLHLAENVKDDSDPHLAENVNEDIKPKQSKLERIREELLKKYQDRQGKQLYIGFPHKVAETEEALEKEVKELTPLIVKVHKPRQKHARFCIVDFATREDRDTAFKQLKKSFSKGDLAKYVVNIPKIESQEQVSELAERKIKSLENKKAKCRLKKASKKALTENQFTSAVIVLNLPKTTSVLQIRELFPNAVDIQVKPAMGKLYKDKSIAAINLPTTMDARNAIKKKLSLGGNQLIIKFDNLKMGRNKKRLNKNNSRNETNKEAIEDSEPLSKKAKLETNLDIPEKNVQINSNPKGNHNDVKPFKGKKPFKQDNPSKKGNKSFKKSNQRFNKKGKNNFKNKSKPVNK